MECIKCNIELDENNHPAYAKKNYVNKCIDCLRAEKRDFAKSIDSKVSNSRSKKCKEKLRIENPKRYSAIQMRASASKRAKKFNLPFEIDLEYILDHCKDECPILGVNLKYGGGDKSNHSASLDRIVPYLGYVKGNVMVISNLANTMKSNATKEDLLEFAQYMLKKHGKAK